MTTMVEIEHLSKSFGRIVAVDDVSLTVGQGEVLGFLGPNGAGKTTTMRMIAGFLTPTSGSVRVCGHDVAVAPIAVKSRIGYLPEGSPAYDDMSVRAFLKFIAAVRGLAPDTVKSRIDAVAEQVALAEVMDRPIEVLSKGYKRRVGLAQALLHDPPVLILDEPTDGLDPNQKHQVRSLIKSMAANKCIIVSTHILEEVRAVCTRAVIIGRGKLLADGTAETLLARLPDYHAVCVDVRTADADAARAALGAISGVDSVVADTPRGDRIVLRAIPQAGQVILDRVAAAVRAGSVPALELYQNRGDLDDAFRLITTGSAPAQAA